MLVIFMWQRLLYPEPLPLSYPQPGFVARPRDRLMLPTRENYLLVDRCPPPPMAPKATLNSFLI